MNNWKPTIQRERLPGKAIETSKGTLIPYSNSLMIRFPFGGFVWNRPHSVDFERDGLVEKTPITDVTRKATFTLYFLGILSINLSIIFSIFNLLNRKKGAQ